MNHLLRDFKAELARGYRERNEFKPAAIAARLVPEADTPKGQAALAELLASHNTLGTVLPPSDDGITTYEYSSIFWAIRLNAIDWLIDEAIYWRELRMEELAMENLNPLLTEDLK